MQPRVIFDFARIKPLAGWSLSGAAVGTGLALYLSRWRIIAPLEMMLAIAAVVLIQWVAHPLNDIMDYDLDRQAPIGDTGRIKPIVDGRISIKETAWLSACFILVIFAILAILIVEQPLLILPASYGVGALLGYNSSRLRLAYRPFTELYLGVPINTLTVLVISYIGSGELSPISLLVGIVFGFAASSFFLSMMSMDFPTDRKNDKLTSIVAFPRLRWCTYYPSIGLFAAVLASVLLFDQMGPGPTIIFAGLAGIAFAVLIWYGHRVDRLRLDFLAEKVTDPEAAAGPLRLGQLYTSIVYAAVLAVFFALMGV
ncbi:MAG TPA: prenyltransferase [Methanomassiliicoccales archaeon]|nr:prenyltransferase [Methanomassiliicoccales archaeon]